MYKIRRTNSDHIIDTIIYILLLLLCFTCIYPFWYELVLSFQTPIAANKLGFRIIPTDFSMDSYRQIFQTNTIYTAYMNTIFRTFIGSVLTVIITFFGAYSLSKKNLPLRNLITIFVLFTMFFDGGLIPSYLVVKDLGLINTRWSLILPGLTSAWYLIITRNFISSIPASMEESARVDGANLVTIVIRILVPVSMPIISVLFIWEAVRHWNSWFDALIYTRDNSKIVLQLLLQKILLQNYSTETMGFNILQQTSNVTTETVKAATIMVSIGPILALYPFLQKYFVKGIMIGSLKG